MDERKKQSWPLWIASATIALPMLYVLSIGPAAKLCQAGMLNYDAMVLIYKPFVYVLTFCPDWIVGPVAFYLSLWGGSL